MLVMSLNSFIIPAASAEPTLVSSKKSLLVSKMYYFKTLDFTFVYLSCFHQWSKDACFCSGYGNSSLIE